MKQYHLSIGDHKVTKLFGGLEIKYDFTVCCARKTYFGVICSLKNTNYHKNYSFNVECSICRTNYLK